LSVLLRPGSIVSASSASASALPILAPKAQKEVARIIDDLRANKTEDARKHLEKASQLAQSDPDISYLWGMYYAQRNDIPKAKEFWEKAIQIFPRHVFSLAALAQLALRTADYGAAIAFLLRAAEAAPSAWRYQEQLAEAYLSQQQY